MKIMKPNLAVAVTNGEPRYLEIIGSSKKSNSALLAQEKPLINSAMTSCPSSSRDDKRSADRYKRDDKRSDDRYNKEERYKRDEETDERAVERSKERSKDRSMRTRPERRPNRKDDRKVLMAEESTKSWEDTDSDAYSSSSSSSSDSEQEEVHCLMAYQASDDEVFDFSNIEFTREDLVQALNDMVHEYKSLSHTFEEIKAENASLKNSSEESSSDELEDTDSLKIELSKLKIENDLLRNEASELKAEVEKFTKEMSSWTQSARAFHKLQEIQKSVHDRTGLGFSSSESSEGETSTQSQPAYDKFNKMSFVKANVIYDCFESITFDDQNSPKLNDNGKAGIGFSKPENSKPSWLKNKLDKDKAKAGRKPFVEQQCLRQQQMFRSKGTSMFTSATSVRSNGTAIVYVSSKFFCLGGTDMLTSSLHVEQQRLLDRSDLIGDRSYGEVSHQSNRRLPPLKRSAAAARCRRKFVSGQLDEENPFVLISSALLVQPDEGVSDLVVDRIGDNLPQSTEKSRILVIPVGARHKCQQAGGRIQTTNKCLRQQQVFRSKERAMFTSAASSSVQGEQTCLCHHYMLNNNAYRLDTGIDRRYKRDWIQELIADTSSEFLQVKFAL
ncbi:hypothetical protein F511_27602 [Dorcoceras hygrometricum]|uniref:Uncharacterized protein n=1 Tax=Dorcoceras hygrometricum TaxID=472368 RepID=A0A2Z7AI32_9LAMI|nr:hypothetical protein F511_27602 [Dorcoceras hygrometricum]